MKNPLLVNALELLRRPGSVKHIILEADPVMVDPGMIDHAVLDSVMIDAAVSASRSSASPSSRSSTLVPGSTIDIDLLAESLSDGIVVNGTIHASFQGECRRCLSPLEGFIDVEVHELYQVQVTDPDAFPIVGDQIDLVPMVRETVLLEIPDAPVCRPDCAGLCPQCGADLNLSTCDCVAEAVDPRWAALEGLREEFPE